MLSFNTKKSTRVATKLRFRKKLSQLLAGALIAPLFSFIPAVLGPSVLPSAQAVPVGTGNCEVDVASSSGVVATSTESFCYIAFTNTGMNSFKVPAQVTTLQILLIGGGGGGGPRYYAGGGGAGEVAVASSYAVTPGSSVAVSVGDGGSSNGNVDTSVASQGYSSWVGSATTLAANGGGAGRSRRQNTMNGSAGGSGGGQGELIPTGTAASVSNLSPYGTATRYGNPGGIKGITPDWFQAGSGGGGAGAVGGNTTGSNTPGAGGSGTDAVASWLSDLAPAMPAAWATATAGGFIAGGGGGGGNLTWGAGGAGGGGDGGNNGGSGGIGKAGVANTGGGGGGSSLTNTVGGVGGSGLIVLKFSNVARPSQNATLSALALSAGSLSPTFASETTSYTASVANSVLSTTVTPTRTQANATITVNGTAVTSGSASGAILLSVGSNTITVVVTAQDGTTSTYTVTVTRAASSDATLSAASIKGQTATLGIPNATLGSETPGAITLTTAQAIGGAATTFDKTDAGATISRIVRYATGSSTSNFESDTAFTNSETTAVSTGDFFIIKVTAADATVRFYRVNVTVNSNVATLSALALSAGTLNPTFTSGTTSYTASVANSDSSITVTPTSNQANATITVNGTSVTSGSASSAISLNVGSNVITVVVTAQDGVTTSTYTVSVTRAEMTITTANIVITAPAAGSTPQTSTSSNGQFTTTISWSPSATTFAVTTAYTATVTITPDAGYTLSGVSSNFFTLNGNAATTANTANAGVFTYLFPATAATITIKNVVITAPAAGSTPQTSTTSNGQFTTTISWSPSVTRFAASTSYTATVTVVPVTGRTLTGVTANFFTLNGKAATTGNTANAGVFSYLFGIQNAICFNGSNQWLNLTSNTNLPTGNTAYTIEAFIKTGTSHSGGITSWGTHGRGATAEGQRNTFSFSTNAPGPGYIHWNSQNPGFVQGRSINDVVFNNTWHHVVAQSDGSSVRIYENGYLVKAATYANNVIDTTNFTIGRTVEGGYFNGCMSNLRIVKGVAVYNGTSTTSANFAVPTSALTAIQSSSTNINAITETQTVLLMNRTNNILLEDSSFGYTLNANGAPTTTYFGPFVPSNDATLSASSIKGVTPTLGTPNSNLSSVIAGAVTLAEGQATSTSLASIFTKRVSGATTKVVKYLSGTTADIANFEAAEDLTASTTTTLSNGDYFIIKVTAVDLTENYYRITITTAAAITLANVVITAPVTGATPQTSITSNGQFTTTISWSGTPTTFAGATAYTATVTVTPVSGYTLSGVSSNFFTLNGNAATSANLANAGVFTYLFPATAAVAITTANVLITAPVAGATPQTSTTSNGQFTTTITWSGTPTTFAAATAYTATVTVLPVTGRTLTGVSANFFTLNGNTATTGNTANAGVFSYLFPATAGSITTADVVITAPVTGATPQTSTTSNGQFTTTITWSPSATTFAVGTAYTATVTVLPVTGRTLTGVAANFFTVNSNAATTGNSANAGVFTYLFPATAALAITTANVVITAPVSGATPQTSTTSNGQFTTTITWSPAATTFASYTTYTANVTVVPVAGRTLTGVTANFFTVNTNAATTGNTADAGVFSYQFPRTAFTGGTVVCTTGSFTITSSTIFQDGTNNANRTCSGTAIIPEGVTLLDYASFSNLSGLTSVQLPSSLVTISTAAFAGCGFTSITIPSTITNVGSQAFQNCLSLRNVTVVGNASTGTSVGSNAFNGTSLDSLVLGVDTGKISIFVGSLSAVRISSLTIGAGLTSIPAGTITRPNDRSFDVQISTFFNYSPAVLTGTGFDLLLPRFTLSSSSAIMNINTAFSGYTITGNTRNATGTAPSSYSISPSLSAGLNFDTTTGLISGTATAGAAQTAYTITGTNGNNQKTATFTLTVNATSITTANVVITAPATGATPQTSTTSNGQFTTTITWSGTPTTFAAGTAYTATVTVAPNAGYVLSGVAANFFTLNGNAATTGNSANAGVFTYLFPATAPAPTITNLDQTLPNYGTTVNVTGTNLSSATVVKIGNTPVATFTAVSATSLSFVVNSPCCTAATISITTPGGTATSVATITPQPQLAVIATQPIAVSKNVGQSVTFSVSVTALLDGGVLSYQWFNGTTPIQGATSATFTFTPTAVTQAGNYYVAVYNTLSGSTSLVASNTAALTLNKATPILSTFANVNKTFGDAPFTITAPTSSVPGSFSYGSGTTSVATVDGSTITIVGQGSSVITAIFTPQNTDDYASGGTITMTLTVAARQLATPQTPTVVVTAGTLKSFTANWSSVANAVAYSLRIYASDGVTLLRTVSSLSGTSKLVNATDFPAIADGTTYKVGMIATGDSNNTGSALSTLSTSFVTNSQYTITYNTTNSTGGTAPAAATFITGSTPYLISANTGNLVRTSFSFSGWNTAADGSGTTYLATGAVTVSPTANLVLHPKWTALKFTVTYFGNNNTGGTAPTDSTEYLNGASVSVSGVGTLVRTGYNFVGWTTDSANTSTVFAAASSITINLASIQLYAKWQVIPYTVIYNSQSGSSVTNGSYTIGGTLTLPSDPNRAGYTFNGWFLNSTGGTALVSPYSPPSTGTLTLFAQWTPIQYTVAYNGNLSGGGTAPVNSATYITGSLIPIVGNTGGLTKAGYTFSDWTLNSQGTGTTYAAASNYTVVTSNVTFYARWIATPYSVTYNATSSTGGSAPTDTSTYTIGQNVPVLGNLGSLVRTGYTFSGWTDNSGGTGTVYSSGNNYQVGVLNISFHPKWTPNVYTITYNKNGASGLPAAATATYTTGADPVTLTSVGTMAKTGFNFGGWSTTSTGSAISGTYTTTADVMLYAVWTIKSISITYSEGTATKTNLSGFPSNTSGNYGTTITLNGTISETTAIDSAQHAFMGWSDGNSVYQRGSSYLLGETNPTFTAIWAKIFAVRYAFNGGTPATGTTEIDSECLAAGNTCTDGQVITAHVAPTRAGYTFAGWIDQNNVAVTGSTFTVASNRYLLYATWTPENYAIAYNTAGGSTPAATFTKQVGQTFTVAPAPTKTGHTFTGWNDGTTIVSPGVTYYVSTSPVTLTAQWTTNVYTVSYDPNGGSGTAIANVSYTFGGNAISLPTAGDLIRTNYTFAGWSETPTGTSVGTTYTPTMSRTLYVVWTVSQYLVTYSGNGGTPSTPSATYSAGSNPLVLPTATRANFTFQGWYSAATDGVLIGLAGATYAPASTTTIYSRWIQDSLVGVKASSLSFISSYAVNPAITATNTFSTSDSAVSITVPAGSLPTGTTVTNWLLSSDEYARALLPGQNNYLLSLVVSWLNIDGTVPVAPDSNPLVMTITNSAIKAGARVYSVVGSNTQLLGVATQDGSVSVNLTTDPQIYVLQTKPAAPTNVTATSGDQSSSVVTWSAPADDGGSTIINFTVTSSGGQSCISSTTTCNFSGLTNGTSYTFTVTATNGIGTSDQSAASAAITPGAAPAVVVPTTPTTPTTPAVTAPVKPLPVRAAYVKAQTPPQISKSADKLICTSGTYTSGYTLDGVLEQGTTSVFTPTSYIYNLLFNLVAQSSISVTTSKNSASWDLKLAPAGVIVTCAVTASNNTLTATESSFQYTAATSAAVAAQNKSIALAESDYKAALVTNSKSYQKALLDNRTKWRAGIAKSRATYYAELERIKKLGSTKSRSALTATALKNLTTLQNKLNSDYKASGPASAKVRDLANKAALNTKNAAIAKANSNYDSAIESLGYGVLIP